jgi:hypothetical protein
MSETPNATDQAAETKAETVPQIRIINRSHEGFRRGGISHPADKTYPVTDFTPEQVIAFQDEPMLTVILDPSAADTVDALREAKGRKAKR